MRFFIKICILFAASQQVVAQEHITLQLEKLESIKTQEKAGDELFFHITEFPATSKLQHFYVPNRPAHWTSNHLNTVSHVGIWQKDAKCEQTDVLISLVEEDIEPWNINDLLGSVMLKIRCQHGKVVKSWAIPDPKITSHFSNEPNTFIFHGENAEYKATFKIN